MRINGFWRNMRALRLTRRRCGLHQIWPWSSSSSPPVRRKSQRVLASVPAEPIRNVFLKELSIIVSDLSADTPTHVFAVYIRQPSPSLSLTERYLYFKSWVFYNPR
ncbi:hypothetical protein JAAARDRAFT_192117 [Jaapia argillacea MUCL 33604]|uniref:Uncharacterized protein n=1 Tax=Jaapia argillacea MUCL 33604 TaxID=933084 RepID=A0A067QAJ7_9AGAM|nr:hypothetical protein JAAARDRAFT_192117 [Jaapia argillacea MUCL 33604]